MVVKKESQRHPAADALDWDEAVNLMRRLYDDGDYRGSMLVAVGCYLGLRISDIRGLRWGDLCEGDVLTMKEQKTGKVRSLKLNPSLKEHAEMCRAALGGPDDEAFIFGGRQYGGSTPVSRQRASQMLSGMKKKYGIRSAKVFSTHSLRKTFGRRVWGSRSAETDAERWR